jgi:large subunit ribosomal protein L10
MSYFVKDLVKSEYLKKFTGMTEFVVVSTTGVSGVDNNIMRGELKKAGMRAVVVRNNLMRRAAEEMGLPASSALFGAGQCTVIYGGSSISSVAKEAVAWAKKLKVIQLKGAFVDGIVMAGDAGVKTAASMPTRAEMHSQIVQIALSPGGVIAGCVKTLIEKLEKEAA